MSATRWSYCPVCQKDEPEMIRRCVSHGSLREDYWIGIEAGILIIRYMCLCRNCKFEFRHSDDLPVVEEESAE